MVINGPYIRIGSGGGGGAAVVTIDGAPSNVVADTYSLDKIILTWDINSTNHEGHKIYISTDNVNFTLKGTVYGITKSFIADSLTISTQYYFYVVAYLSTTESAKSYASALILDAWYLRGGITASKCVAAYDAANATTLANSYINLKNPGTYNLNPLVAPAFRPGKGWEFNGSTTKLDTGITAGTGWSMIVRFSDGYNIGDQQLAGAYVTKSFNLANRINTSPIKVQYGNSGNILVAPAMLAGCLAVAGPKGYRNGVNEGGDIATGTMPAASIYIGTQHAGAGYGFLRGKISHVAIYNDTLTPTEVAAVSNVLVYHDGIMENYVKLGLGMFIHFNMATFGPDEYAAGNQAADTFNPTDLVIDEWLDTAVLGGMKYACLTSSHIDGFALWPTAWHETGYSPYSVAETSWYVSHGNKDIVSDFVTGCRTRGLKPCLYYCFRNYTHEIRSGTNEDTDITAYTNMITTQLTELLTNYGEITALWLDCYIWDILLSDIPYATIYNLVKGIQPNCLIIVNAQLVNPHVSSEILEFETYTMGDLPADKGSFAEQCVTIRTDHKWFYHTGQTNDAADLISKTDLNAKKAQVNSRNGTYLINVTPDKTGHLPALQKSIIESLPL